jgi:hypothetical protein
MEPLNIPFIKERISSAHNNFIKTVGQIPDKITADHQLLLKRMSTRIETIVKCFIDTGIIDNISQSLQNGDGDRSCVVFKLTKCGFDKAVYIWTDGNNININAFHFPFRSGLNFEDEITIREINFDSYNWVEFSDKLIHFIHQIIYARLKSIETKIFD